VCVCVCVIVMYTHVCSYQKLKAKWEVKNHEVRLANTRIEESGHHRLLTEIQELRDFISKTIYSCNSK